MKIQKFSMIGIVLIMFLALSLLAFGSEWEGYSTDADDYYLLHTASGADETDIDKGIITSDGLGTPFSEGTAWVVNNSQLEYYQDTTKTSPNMYMHSEPIASNTSNVTFYMYVDYKHPDKWLNPAVVAPVYFYEGNDTASWIILLYVADQKIFQHSQYDNGNGLTVCDLGALNQSYTLKAIFDNTNSEVSFSCYNYNTSTLTTVEKRDYRIADQSYKGMQLIGGGDGTPLQSFFGIDDIMVYEGNNRTDAPIPDLENYTNIKAAEIETETFQFSSSTYTQVLNTEFNVSDSVDLFVMTSFNAQKTSGSPTSELFGRIYIDNETLYDGSLRTISTSGKGLTGFPILNKEGLTTGTHNITIEMRRTLAGIVEISNFDMILQECDSEENQCFQHTFIDDVFSQAGASEELSYEFSHTKNITSDTLAIVHQTLSSDGTAPFTQRITDELNATISPYWHRYMDDSSDVGFAGMIYIENETSGTINRNILSSCDGGVTCTANTTIFYMDLRDTNNKLINHFSSSMGSSETAAGSNLVDSKTITSKNSSSLLISAAVSFSSNTGSHTPTITLNMTEADCEIQKQRVLSGNLDRASVILYHICDGLSIDSTYTANLYIQNDGGENVSVYGSSIIGYEVSEIGLAALNTPPQEFNITNPIDTLSYNNDLNITWEASIDSDNDSLVYDIFIDNGTETKIGDDVSDLYFNFDTTLYNDGDWLLRVEANDSRKGFRSSYRNFTIDNSPPSLTINFPLTDNSTEWFYGLPLLFNATGTDNREIWSLNNTCDDYSNITTSILSDTYSYLDWETFYNVGQQNCTMTLCDSHTAQEIRDYNIDYNVNGRYIQFDEVRINVGAALDDITYEKEFDRYTFCFDLRTPRKILPVTLPNHCEHIPDSEYSGHFVCGDKWLDFEPYDVNVNNRNVQIDVEGIDNICFNSIGSLNCVSEDYNFLLINDSNAPVITLIAPENDTNASYLNPHSFDYNVSDISGITSCELLFSGVSNVTDSDIENNAVNTFQLSLPIGEYDWSVRCTDLLSQQNTSETRRLNSVQLPSTLSLNTCPTSLTGVSLLALFVVISLGFLFMGVAFKNSVLGIFGSIMIIVSAWYLSPCQAMLSYVIGAVGIVMLIVSALATWEA